MRPTRARQRWWRRPSPFELLALAALFVSAATVLRGALSLVSVVDPMVPVVTDLSSTLQDASHPRSSASVAIDVDASLVASLSARAPLVTDVELDLLRRVLDATRRAVRAECSWRRRSDTRRRAPPTALLVAAHARYKLVLDAVARTLVAAAATRSPARFAHIARLFDQRYWPFAPAFGEFLFGCTSQTQEDGALEFVLAVVAADIERRNVTGTALAANNTGSGGHGGNAFGPRPPLLDRGVHRAVEMCSGIGSENNLAYFALLYGFDTLMVDGAHTHEARAFFTQPHMPRTMHTPTFSDAFLTRDKVNSVVRDAGFHGSIDLLSLDMDGNDWHMWRALTAVQPRVVIVEWQEMWYDGERKSMAYNAEHVASDKLLADMGASLSAFIALGAERHYRLVGCVWFNAIFVHNDFAQLVLPAFNATKCYAHHKGSYALRLAQRRARADRYNWIDV